MDPVTRRRTPAAGGDVALVGTYAPAGDPGIVAVATDGDRLAGIGELAGIENPSFVLPHSDGTYAYAVSEIEDGVVHALRVDRDGGAVVLTDLGGRASGGDHPCHLAIDASGRWLAAANYGTGTVALFPIRGDGTLDAATAVVRHEGSGPRHDRQEGPHAHSSAFTPGGRHLLVADLGIDRVVVYRVDCGSLNRIGELGSASGAGPRHLAFHPDGRHVFVVNELDSTLTACRWEAGSLRHLQTTSTLPAETPGNLAAEVRIAAGGSRVLVSNRGADSIAVFGFDEGAGLEPIASHPCGGSWPRSFALTPDDRRVLVAAQLSDRILLLPALGETADPGVPLAVLGLSQPSSVAFV